MNCLIVNADDLGLCPSVTDGIFEAHDHGIVNSASLIVTGEDAARAVEGAATRPDLRIGVHLALVEGVPALPPETVPSLVRPDGSFEDSFRGFVWRYVTGRVSLDQVQRELRAQVQTAVDMGVRIAHLDSHQHIHLLPGIFDIALTLCRQYDIPRIRIPRAGLRDITSGGPSQWTLELLSRWAWMRLRRSGGKVWACEQFLGAVHSCRLTEEALGQLLASVRPGTTELMCHPGKGANADLQRYPWGVNWARELEVLIRARSSGLG